MWKRREINMLTKGLSLIRKRREINIKQHRWTNLAWKNTAQHVWDNRSSREKVRKLIDWQPKVMQVIIESRGIKLLVKFATFLMFYPDF